MITRDSSLRDLIWWAREEGLAAKPEIPLEIHQRTYPKGTTVSRAPGAPDVIGGLPFTEEFVAYVLGNLTSTSVIQALRVMRNPGKKSPQSLEYRVAWAVVRGGYTDMSLLATVLRAPERLVRQATDRGLRLLFETAERLTPPEPVAESSQVEKVPFQASRVSARDIALTGRSNRGPIVADRPLAHLRER